MIRQLMKRNAAWIATPVIAVMFVILSVWHPRSLGSLGIFSLVIMSAIGSELLSNCTLYEAALPVEGRDLWLSRVLSLLTLLWGPVLAAVMAFAAMGTPALPLLEVAAVYTVLLLAVKCFRIREFSSPRWSRIPGYCIIFSALSVPLLLQSNWPPAGPVLAGCAIASGALFFKGWTSVPKSFQIAPPEAAAVGRWFKPRDVHASRWVWSPVLRSAWGWGWQTTLLLLAVLSQLAIGSLVAAYVSLWISLIVMHTQGRWLVALPVAPRTLFGIVALPPAAAVVAGFVLGIFFDPDLPLDPRLRLMVLAAELALLYGTLFLGQFDGWRRLSQLRRWVRQTPFVLAGLAILAAAYWHASVFEALRRATAVLPANVWLLSVVLAIPVVAAYWLAEKVFGEQEIGRRVTTREPWPG